MNLVLLEAGEMGTDGNVRLSGPRAAHLLHVLNVVPEQRVRIGIVDGPKGSGTVVEIDQKSVTLRCEFDATVPERPRVDLLLALPRPKVLRRLWAQLAAVGVGQIILTNAEKVERDYFGTHVVTPECYGPLLIEGLQQARDTRLPRVSIHRRFKVLIEDDLDGLFGDGIRLLADPTEARSPSATLSAGAARGDRRVLLAVGPEGGWNTFERDLLSAHGFQGIGMGVRTLRTDTACIALLALVHDALTSMPRP